MSRPRPLPEGTLVAFYGDDFTGSSAAMEALAFAGLDTVLFLAPPTPERLAAFSGYRGIGIAGVARSRDPDWMSRHLPPIFRLLKGLGAPVVHYKVCSTFDSAPHVGSIGRAIDLAADIFDGWIPLVVGDPGMGRFQSFGHLFALAQGKGYRLDRGMQSKVLAIGAKGVDASVIPDICSVPPMLTQLKIVDVRCFPNFPDKY